MSKRGNNEGSAYEDRPGSWRGAITLSNGKRKYFRGKTRAAVAKKITSALADLDKGLPITTNERLTVAGYLERWLAEIVKPKRRASTYRGYNVNVRRHIVPALGSVPLTKLTPLQVQRLLNDLERTGLSARTAQYVHATLRVALKQALRWGLVVRNVATLVDAPVLNRAEVQPLTPETAKQLLAAVAGDRLQALYSVAMALGLRRGEALGLRWEDVDLEQRRQLHIRVQLQRVTGQGLQLVDVKTASSRRVLDLPDPIVVALIAHRERQRFERRAAGWQEHGLVFTTTIGTPIETGNLWRSYHRLLAQAGLPSARFHDLRHTAASLLLAQGCELWEVSRILGHSGLQITSDTYAHLYPQARRAAADRMGAWLEAAQ